MSDINPHSGQRSAEQVNRNFVAVNEWMKLMQTQHNELHGMVVRLQTTIAQVQQENALLRQLYGKALADYMGHGPTG